MWVLRSVQQERVIKYGFVHVSGSQLYCFWDYRHFHCARSCFSVTLPLFFLDIERHWGNFNASMSSEVIWQRCFARLVLNEPNDQRFFILYMTTRGNDINSNLQDSRDNKSNSNRYLYERVKVYYYKHLGFYCLLMKRHADCTFSVTHFHFCFMYFFPQMNKNVLEKTRFQRCHGPYWDLKNLTLFPRDSFIHK